jgi:hypothetical protein
VRCVFRFFHFARLDRGRKDGSPRFSGSSDGTRGPAFAQTQKVAARCRIAVRACSPPEPPAFPLDATVQIARQVPHLCNTPFLTLPRV